MDYQEIHGDLVALALEGKFDVVAHGCNCFCRQKRGLAPQMVKAFGTDQFPLEQKEREIPGSWHDDESDYEPTGYEGDINKLGQIDEVGKYIWENHPMGNGKPVAMNGMTVGQKGVRTLIVVNCYTQYHYSGPEHSKPLDYDALTLCFKKLNHKFRGQHIGLPQIGCGLAGGSWSIIQKLIKAHLADCKVTVVIYAPTLSS